MEWGKYKNDSKFEKGHIELPKMNTITKIRKSLSGLKQGEQS